MKKYIANIITVSRVVFSLPILFIPISSTWFYILYLFCGFTDMIDGTVARKTGAVSRFGSRLDTVADFVFMLACGIKILPIIEIPKFLWVWIALIAITKIFNIAFVFIRKKKLISIHSVANKITGLALFLLPLTLALLDATYSVAAVCALATIAAVGEAWFVVKGEEA